MLLSTLTLALLCGSILAQFPFTGEHKISRCPAVNRATDKTTTIEIHYVDVNPSAKDTLIFVHGWPGVWSVWKHQINEFKNDYRVIAIDVRGMGASTHPGDVEGSATTDDFVNDLTCVLKHADVIGKPVCIGHDWGSSICWEAGRARHDVFSGVVSLAVPYLPSAGPYTPIEAFLTAFPKLAYQVYFRDSVESAAAELEADVRRTIRIVYKHSNSTAPDAFLTSSTSFLAPFDGTELPRSLLMTQEEEDYLVDQYTKSGFKNSLQFYQHKNRYLSWQAAHYNGTFNVNVPSLAIYPSKDSVADWSVVSQIVKSKTFVSQFEEVIIPTAHCPHMERPEEVNAHLSDWLTRTFTSGAGIFKRAEDEL